MHSSLLLYFSNSKNKNQKPVGYIKTFELKRSVPGYEKASYFGHWPVDSSVPCLNSQNQTLLWGQPVTAPKPVKICLWIPTLTENKTRKLPGDFAVKLLKHFIMFLTSETYQMVKYFFLNIITI